MERVARPCDLFGTGHGLSATPAMVVHEPPRGTQPQAMTAAPRFFRRRTSENRGKERAMSVTTATRPNLRGAAREVLDFHRSGFGGGPW
ncbi:hypothetical protein GCM10009665_26750 [Kitasatospora nipponensis]|uniref:Uncharacterized protein n=1 Tax=Kitasatospora nipponensis TaxID=258049 RepID=A0ABP4GWN5_9ACTN